MLQNGACDSLRSTAVVDVLDYKVCLAILGTLGATVVRIIEARIVVVQQLHLIRPLVAELDVQFVSVLAHLASTLNFDQVLLLP